MEGYCPSLLFHSCDKTLFQKQLGKRRVYFAVYCEGKPRLKQGINTEAGLEAEAMKESCLLACSVFFMQPNTTCPEVALPTTGWTLPQQSFIKKFPTDLHTGQSDGSGVSVEVLSSKAVPACVKLTKN